jgi:hypothetical protein
VSGGGSQLPPLGRGEIAMATARLGRVDDAIVAVRSRTAAVRARGSILAMTEVRIQHTSYFATTKPE